MPVLRYKTSKEKWDGLTRIARDHLKICELGRLCEDVVKRIEERGDAELDFEVAFQIDNLKDFHKATHNQPDHPCPHCTRYMSEATGCSKCPLFDETAAVCCHEWMMVKRFLWRARGLA